jgi:DNA invertase Pin-like site-specific DNA recombinase
MKPRAIGIIRVSQIARKTEAESPEVQRRLIQSFVERQGWELVDLLNENEQRGGNVSGAADLSKRPGLGPAVERASAGKTQIIVAADLSRLFRDLDVQRATIAQIEQVGGEFWTVADGRVSQQNAADKFKSGVQGLMNEYQRNYAKEKSRLAVAIAIEKGKVPWHQTAPGYERSDQSCLSPDANVRPVIERAFEMRASGSTVDAVRQHLAAHGIVRSYHGTSHLLRDRVYVGEIHFGTHTPNLEAHEPIIGRELFDRVQGIAVPRGRKAKSDRLLARLGVLRCGSCGARMVVGTSNNSSYYLYRCPPNGNCARRQTISAEIVEGKVVSEVKDLVAGITGRASGASGVAETLAELDRRQEALDTAVRSLAAAGLTGEPVAAETLAELRQARDEVKARYDAGVQADEALSMSVTIDDWDALTLDEQRGLVRAVLDRVVIHPGRGVDRIEIAHRG